jgi:hypothetical protein
MGEWILVLSRLRVSLNQRRNSPEAAVAYG